LRTFPFIDDILIWNNDPTATFSLDDKNTRVIPSVENMMVYGRYLCTAHARHPIIFAQDDDWLVPHIAQLHELFMADPTRIACLLHPDHIKKHREQQYGVAQMVLMGWGAFFRCDWVSVLDRYVAAYGKDPLFLRETDRLFSILLHRAHQSLIAMPEALPGTTAPEAMYHQPEHWHMRQEAIRRALGILGVEYDPADHPLIPA